MDFYSLFYWVSVSDGVKSFLDRSSDLFSWFSAIAFIVYLIVSIAQASEVATSGADSDDAKSLGIWRKSFGTAFTLFLIFAMITWAGYVLVPSKKDALIIIAGGAVGNFITRDSSSKQIPHDVMTLLNEKIKAEIKNTKLSDVVPELAKDTLKSKSKEELIQILEDQQKNK